jgi:sialic acid synthase SpsE
MNIDIAGRAIGEDQPTYFIADIAASHDGELGRAVELIHLAAEAGADAAKFQNFTAAKIVSDRGFREIGGLSHQASWSKSVFEVYEDASIPHEWTPTLKAACDEAGIAYFSAAYDLEAVDMLEPYVPAYKIGSGDITWLESLDYTARKGKPMLLATGAAGLAEVVEAVDTIRESNRDLVLMQCNTNYTASPENLKFLSLRVLSSYAALFPDVILGLSDHTPGHTSVLGAVALGRACRREALHRRHRSRGPRPRVLDGSCHVARDGRPHARSRGRARRHRQAGRAERGRDRRRAATRGARRTRDRRRHGAHARGPHGGASGDSRPSCPPTGSVS